MTKKQICMLEKQIKNEERKNLGNDIKYVQNLNDWGKKFIYKEQNQVITQPVNISNKQENNSPVNSNPQ